MKTMQTRNLMMCALFAALIAAGAFIKIPIPVVPFTLQLLFTMLAGLLLGGKLGAISVGVYILMGLIGLPVFVEGGGIAYIFKPTFGYLIGFAAASYVTGCIAHQAALPSFRLKTELMPYFDPDAVSPKGTPSNPYFRQAP